VRPDIPCRGVANIDWASLVSGGVAGGVVSGWAATRRERGAQLRQRMLEVADAYVATLTEVITSICSTEGSRDLDQAVKRLDDLDVVVARVELLFSPDSAASKHAIEGAVAVREAMYRRRRLDDAANDDLTCEERLHLAVGSAEREARGFARRAGMIIRSGGRHPWPARALEKARMARFKASATGGRLVRAQRALVEAMNESEKTELEYRQALRVYAEQEGISVDEAKARAQGWLEQDEGEPGGEGGPASADRA
jgi:hypothetical protein